MLYASVCRTTIHYCFKKKKLEQCGYKRCFKKNENDLDMDAIHRRQEYKFCY